MVIPRFRRACFVGCEAVYGRQTPTQIQTRFGGFSFGPVLWVVSATSLPLAILQRERERKKETERERDANTEKRPRRKRKGGGREGETSSGGRSQNVLR